MGGQQYSESRYAFSDEVDGKLKALESRVDAKIEDTRSQIQIVVDKLNDISERLVSVEVHNDLLKRMFENILTNEKIVLTQEESAGCKCQKEQSKKAKSIVWLSLSDALAEIRNKYGVIGNGILGKSLIYAGYAEQKEYTKDKHYYLTKRGKNLGWLREVVDNSSNTYIEIDSEHIDDCYEAICEYNEFVNGARKVY